MIKRRHSADGSRRVSPTNGVHFSGIRFTANGPCAQQPGPLGRRPETLQSNVAATQPERIDVAKHSSSSQRRLTIAKYTCGTVKNS